MISYFSSQVLRLDLALTVLCAALFCVCGVGCQHLFNRPSNETASPEALLKPSKMSPDSVVVEVSVVSIPATDKAKLDELWKSLDVTRIEIEKRKTWDRNGLRIAFSGNALPVQYEKILELEKQVVDTNGGDPQETKLAPRRRIQSRAGKPFRIATQNVRKELTWILEQEDGYRKGGSLVQAQTEFVVRTFPKGDGSVAILLEPEILFGDSKQVVTPSQNSFIYQSRRDSIPLPDLQLRTELGLGESLIVSGIPNSKKGNLFGLGETFFVEEDGSVKFFVIRIAQTQYDNLFDSSIDQEPLESLTE